MTSSTTKNTVAEQLALLAALIENSDDALCATTLEGIISLWNPATERLFGYSADEAISRHISLVADDAHKKEIDEFLERVKQGDKVFHHPTVRKRKDGSELNVSLTMAPIRDGSRNSIGAVTIARDMTIQKQFEEKVKSQQQQLIQTAKMASLGTLVSGIAHEINNPVNLILLHNTLFQKLWEDLKPLLTEKAATEPGRKYAGLSYQYLMENIDQHLSDMQMATGRILKIIEGLKNFTRKANPEERREIDIKTCIANALKLSETTMKKSSITLQQQLAEHLPKIQANQGQIEQVLLNLIINAIQAIDHESGKIDISSYARAGDAMVCVAIADNGRGIDPGLHDKIFDPFVTDRQSSGGTGLGLAIAYNLINEHGGKIEFTSKKAQGTTFRILLPTVLQKETVKILIADDEVSMRTSIEKALSRNSRFITETAANGYQACIKLGAFRPDILILDLMMPEMNGLEVCKIIKAEPALSGVDVFIMTGYVKSQLLEGIRNIGFTTIINKPFKLPNLVRMIEESADKKKDSRGKG